MALLHSTMLPLGTPLPDFELQDTVGGETWSRQRVAGKPVLLAVICNHCPYVKRIKPGLAELARSLQESGVQVLAVSPNDPAIVPSDAPDKMAEDAQAHGYGFPYLFDEDQSLARSLDAVATPEFYLFDHKGKLVYRGRMDGAAPGNQVANDGADIQAAVEALLAGQPAVDNQQPSMGCSIKWRA